jgi:uncharacterized protein
VKAFFCKLIAPRPTFAQDMSGEEAALMQEHAVYWTDWMAKGRVVTFGLVADPTGAYGIAVVEVDDEAEVRSLTGNDPTIRSGRGFRFDVYPMPLGAAHP